MAGGVVDSTGAEIGTATFIETPNEGVLIRLSLMNAPPGEHAVHVHETGRCEPSFSAAGSHYAPEDESHGVLHEEGSHAGDLPNVTVPESGRLEVELVATDLTLRPNEENSLFDGDGSALIMHEGADDFLAKPFELPELEARLVALRTGPGVRSSARRRSRGVSSYMGSRNRR